jgi:hypothetical protein
VSSKPKNKAKNLVISEMDFESKLRPQLKSPCLEMFMKKAILPTVLFAIFASQNANAANEGRELLFGPSSSKANANATNESKRIPLFKKESASDLSGQAAPTKASQETVRRDRSEKRIVEVKSVVAERSAHVGAAQVSPVPQVSGAASAGSRVALFHKVEVAPKSESSPKVSIDKPRVAAIIGDSASKALPDNKGLAGGAKTLVAVGSSKVTPLPAEMGKQRIQLFSKTNENTSSNDAAGRSQDDRGVRALAQEAKAVPKVARNDLPAVSKPSVLDVNVKDVAKNDSPNRVVVPQVTTAQHYERNRGSVPSTETARVDQSGVKSVVAGGPSEAKPGSEGIAEIVKNADPVLRPPVAKDKRARSNDSVAVVSPIRIIAGQDPYAQRNGVLKRARGSFAIGFQVQDTSHNFTSDATNLPILNVISESAGIIVTPAYAHRTESLREHIANRTFPLLHIDPSFFGTAKAAGYKPIAMVEAEKVISLVVPAGSKIKSFSDVSSAKIGVDTSYPLSSALASLFSEKQNISVVDTDTGSVQGILRTIKSGSVDAIALSTDQAASVLSNSHGTLRAVHDTRPQLVFGWWVDAESLSQKEVNAVAQSVGGMGRLGKENRIASDSYAAGWNIPGYEVKAISIGYENAVSNGDKLLSLMSAHHGSLAKENR